MEAGVMTASGTIPLGAVVQIDNVKVQAHTDEVVRAKVEETLNACLDAEANHLFGALKSERIEGCKNTQAGSSYDLQLQTKAGEVVLKLRRRPSGRRSSPQFRFSQTSARKTCGKSGMAFGETLSYCDPVARAPTTRWNVDA